MSGKPEVDALHAVLGVAIDDLHPVLGGVLHRHTVDAQMIGSARSQPRRADQIGSSDKDVRLADGARGGVEEEITAEDCPVVSAACRLPGDEKAPGVALSTGLDREAMCVG